MNLAIRGRPRTTTSLYYRLLLLGHLLLMSIVMPAAAQSSHPPSPQYGVSPHGTILEWRAETPLTRDAMERAGFTMMELGDTRQYVQLLTFRAHDHAPPPTLTIEYLDSLPIDDTSTMVQAAPEYRPQIPIGEPRPNLAASLPQQTTATDIVSLDETNRYATTPVFILREASWYGQHLLVVAITPLFMPDSSGVRHVTHVRALLHNAEPFEPLTHPSPSPPAPASTPPAPSPLANRAIARIRVEQTGLQRITGAALTNQGISLATLVPSRLQLWYQGTPIAMEEHGTADGHFDITDELRFFAPTPGDRWNTTDIYWLTQESSPGLRFSLRDTTPTTTTLRTTAYERHTWRENTYYDSMLPGDDGDHWFLANLRATPGHDAPSVTIRLAPTLPLAPGTMTITVTGTTYTNGPHHLALSLDGSRTYEKRWHSIGNWQWRFTIPSPAASPYPPDYPLTISLLPGDTPTATLINTVSWEWPISLDMAQQGALFWGEDGIWHYQLTNAPTNYALYDVTDPAMPTVLTLTDGNTPSFEDGPSRRAYLLSGPTTLHSPQIAIHTPPNLPTGAQVIYLAPKEFHAALAPLLTLRQQQGYTVALVDVADVYHLWSFSHTDPEAIRSFMRFAAATWNPAPQALILVGDGSADPHDWLGHSNPTHIPPYLAMVDRWLGETACDTCFVRLDHDDPRDDPLPNLMIGRLPVKTTAELVSLVQKIITYETHDEHAPWHSRVVYVADNYIDEQGNADPAGDFSLFAEQSIQEQPSTMLIERVFYDPSPTHSTASWRHPNAQHAHQQVVAALDAGAAFVNYLGHGFFWQWAVTDPSSATPYLLSIYNIERLKNGHRLPVVLGLTCLTSAFQQPRPTGTIMDEEFVLHPNGGAIATWGSSGFSVSYGHDALQRGFYRVLWHQHTSPSPPLGTLTMAGYLELFSTESCCQDAISTFILLGDPLTRPNISPIPPLYLPLLTVTTDSSPSPNQRRASSPY